MTTNIGFPSLVGHTIEGKMVYAEVEPSGSRWLPLPGRTSRWWFEVHHKHEPDEQGCDTTTHAYTPGGSGGGFTLRSCLVRAATAVDQVVERLEREERAEALLLQDWGDDWDSDG